MSTGIQTVGINPSAISYTLGGVEWSLVEEGSTLARAVDFPKQWEYGEINVAKTVASDGRHYRVIFSQALVHPEQIPITLPPPCLSVAGSFLPQTIGTPEGRKARLGQSIHHW